MSEKQILNNILKTYLDNLLRKTNVNETLELEAIFGTRGIQKITKINYDNVIRTLKSVGFVLNKSNYLLNSAFIFICMNGYNVLKIVY